MKRHCAFGADTLASVQRRYPDNQFLRMGVDVARSHHEHWDGSGYPDGLQGKSIPFAARIVALADVYDALTSKRCYRAPVAHEEVCRTIHQASGTQFDPDVVAAFKAAEDSFRRIRLDLHD
jgi:putative two-component system response regulator